MSAGRCVTASPTHPDPSTCVAAAPASGLFEAGRPRRDGVASPVPGVAAPRRPDFGLSAITPPGYPPGSFPTGPGPGVRQAVVPPPARPASSPRETR
jgi:hypothetical protein